MPMSREKDSKKENARELAQASTRRSSDRRTLSRQPHVSSFRSDQQSTRSLAFWLKHGGAFFSRLSYTVRILYFFPVCANSSSLPLSGSVLSLISPKVSIPRTVLWRANDLRAASSSSSSGGDESARAGLKSPRLIVAADTPLLGD